MDFVIFLMLINFAMLSAIFILMLIARPYVNEILVTLYALARKDDSHE